jgi:hypothetical protein
MSIYQAKDSNIAKGEFEFESSHYFYNGTSATQPQHSQPPDRIQQNGFSTLYQPNLVQGSSGSYCFQVRCFTKSFASC